MVEMKAIPTQKGDFHRVRVNLEANAPVVRLVTLKPEGKESIMIQIKYEKIPRHCTYCGMMGHVYLECGTGEYTEDEIQYGEWMLADESTWRPGTPRVRNSSGEERPWQRNDRAGRATGWGRGGDRQGRGQPPRDTMWRAKKADTGDNASIGACKRSSTEADLNNGKDDLADTASSPAKPINEVKHAEGDREAKKKLNIEDVQTEDGEHEVPPPPSRYISPRKRRNTRRTWWGRKLIIWRVSSRSAARNNELP